MKVHMASFLQDTLEELETRQHNDDSFATFREKMRTGDLVDADEVVKFAHLFEDDITIDNLSRYLSLFSCLNLDSYHLASFLPSLSPPSSSLQFNPAS